MSSYKNKKKNKQTIKNDNYLIYGPIIGLTIGLIIAFILLIITDNMFWMIIPIVTLFISLAVATFLSNKSAGKNKSKNLKSK